MDGSFPSLAGRRSPVVPPSFAQKVSRRAMSKSLIPKIDLPRYFTVTSMGLGPHQVAVKVDAEVTGSPHFNSTKTFDKTNLVLDDFIDLFPVDRDKVPKMARFFLAAIAMPREFELAASRVDGSHNKIELSFELQGESGDKRWSKTFDTSNLNLTDLGVLLDWAKEAAKHQHR